MSSARFDLPTGSLSPEQARLVLSAMPFDITFVDEDDVVTYYNESYRIFSRKPSDIGRDVVSCHSSGVQGRVAQLISELKSGWRDSAEFIEKTDGRLVDVRYIALRDDAGEYRGVLEVVRYVDEPMGSALGDEDGA